MAKTIYDVSLADVLPFNMRSEPVILALCAAIDVQNKFVVKAIDGISVLNNIENQPEAVTDLLAVEQGTPYYNQALPLDVRRALVANGGKVNSIKGTKAAVEQTVKAAFGSCSVQEWFEYGGQPYCFRVLVNDFPDSSTQMAEINRAIAASQNLRSYLDEVIIVATTTAASLYMASTFELAVYVNTKMQAPQ